MFTLVLSLFSLTALALDKHTPGDTCKKDNLGKSSCSRDSTKVVSCVDASPLHALFRAKAKLTPLVGA